MSAGELLGITIASVRPGEVACRLTITEEHLNQGLITHGGVLFTLADTALGLAANPAGQATTWAGTGFSLHLYRAVRVGETVCAHAVVEHQTRNLTVCRVEIDREGDAQRIGILTAQLLRLPFRPADGDGTREVRPADAHGPLLGAMRAAYRSELTPPDPVGAAATVAAAAIIYLQGQPRGYATIVGTRPAGRIGELWIHPGWRRQGLGRALRDGVRRLAGELGFDELGLDPGRCGPAAV